MSRFIEERYNNLLFNIFIPALHSGDLIIDFDGDSAYANKERTFFKPAGAFVHFIIDYIRAFESGSPENTFYFTLKKDQIGGVDSGRYWLFIYDMEFKGFFNTRSYEYFLSDKTGSRVICLDEDNRKSLLREAKTGKIPTDISYDDFDEIRMRVEDAAEERKEQFAAEAMGKNNVKIGSRIKAIKNLSEIRIKDLEDEIVGATAKDEERIHRAIQREKKKVADKVAILEEKTKYVGTYALDALCLVDVL